MGKSKYVVTITRQFGSMGRPIAKKWPRSLGLNIMTGISWARQPES